MDRLRSGSHTRLIRLLGLLLMLCGASRQVSADPSLVFSVLPTSRSVDTTGVATAFLTVINAGDTIATDVSITLQTQIAGQLQFRTTDPATNAVTGTLNQPVDIPPGAAQTFVIGITPTGTIPPQDVRLIVAGSNTSSVSSVVGVDTLFLSAGNNPSDVIALVATPSGDGIASISESGGATAFAIATFNVGAGGQITASVDRGSANYPATLLICRTNAASGECLEAPSPSVTSSMPASSVGTFAVFVTSTGAIPFEPANNRVFVRFRDASGVVRGATSVAVRTTGVTSLSVQAFDEVGGAAVGGTFNVQLNGVLVGQTNANGQFSRSVPAVPTTIRIARPGAAGTAFANLQPSEPQLLNIPVSATGSVDYVGLTIAQAAGGVVPSNITSFTAGVPGRRIAQVHSIFLQSPLQTFSDNLSQTFQITAAGAIQPSSVANLVTLLGQRAANNGLMELEVTGVDTNGMEFVAVGEFNWGQYTLSGVLVPPAGTSVPVGNVPISLTMGSRKVNLTATTNAGGAFSFTFVPRGTVSLSAVVTAGEAVYTALAAVTFTGPTNVQLQLAGVSAGASQPLKVLSSDGPPAFAADVAAHRAALSQTVLAPPQIEYDTSATATGGAKDVAIVGEATCTLVAAPSQRTLPITYIVSTAEYPTYVLAQSQFDDRWSVSVFRADGTPVFQTGLISVNSQVSAQPIWLANGSTGLISVPIVVPANATTLKLRVTSVNIGDGLLPTTVTANCPVDASLRFEKEMIEDSHKGEVRNISLPRPDADQNLASNKRTALLKFTPPTLVVDLTSIQLKIKNESNNEYAVAPAQAILRSPGNIELTTTFGFGNGASPFSAAAGPVAKKIRYVVQATATLNGQPVTLQAAESKVLAPLWRAKDIRDQVSYYGTIPADHNDWATSCTFSWMQANLNKLRPLNDISAHHGRAPFFPHGSSHTRGRHIDMFHFYVNASLATPTPGQSGSGGRYYDELAQRAAIVAAGSATPGYAEALAILRSWTVATRSGVNALLSAGAGQVIYAKGNAIGAAPEGWADKLFREGRLPNGNLDSTLGSWTPTGNGNYRTNSDHNNHVHIDLKSVQLSNQCDASPN